MEFVHSFSVAYLFLGLSSVTSSTCKIFAVLLFDPELFHMEGVREAGPGFGLSPCWGLGTAPGSQE